MAEIIAKNTNSGSKHARKANPRIDLTPMVDLGFLLITFFIFTTSLSEPHTMEMQMPADGEGTALAHHTAMTILLNKNHQVLYYSGVDAMDNKFENLTETNFNNSGIRNALLNHTQNVKQAFADGLKGSTAKDFPFVIIKAGKQSDYGDLVNLLDELMICNIESYALMDTTPDEDKEMAKRIH